MGLNKDDEDIEIEETFMAGVLSTYVGGTD
jgi:hypothetical protein